MMRLIRKSVKVKIQNVADYYWSVTEKDNFDKVKDFPQPIPPWKCFMMDYKTPPTIKTEEATIKVPPDRLVNYAVLGTSIKTDSGFEIAFVCFLRRAISNSKFRIGGTTMTLDNNGNLIPMDKTPAWTTWWCIGTDRQDHENLANLNDTFINPVLLSLSLVNCRNVSQKENKLEPGLKIHRQKSGKMNIDKYYTLEINAFKNFARSQSNGTSSGIKQSLHICRGHFKDFTEHGLFGKYKGRFWWEMQLRGDEKRGEIVKDYSVSKLQNIIP